MDEQKVRAYLTKLAEDKAFQDRMQAAKTPEDALAEAKKNGFDFDADEFRELMIRLTISVKQAKGEELSDEELPKCTVIVPAYNEGEYVLTALRSVAACDYPAGKLEIIAVNDGSQDDTWEWMRKAEQEFQKLHGCLPSDRRAKRPLWVVVIMRQKRVTATFYAIRRRSGDGVRL